MPYKREDSRFFWAQYYVEGTKYNESTGTAIEREAEAFLRRRITEKRASQEGFMDFVGPQRVTVAMAELKATGKVYCRPRN